MQYIQWILSYVDIWANKYDLAKCITVNITQDTLDTLHCSALLVNMSSTIAKRLVSISSISFIVFK